MALAQNATRSGEGHNIIYGQEIWRILQLTDQRQLMLDQSFYPLAGAIGVTPL